MFGTQSIALPVASALFLLWLLVYLVKSLSFHKKYNFPNLVPGVPVLGNLLDIPKDIAARRIYLHKLAQKYGEMYTQDHRPFPAPQPEPVLIILLRTGIR